MNHWNRQWSSKCRFVGSLVKRKLKKKYYSIIEKNSRSNNCPFFRSHHYGIPVKLISSLSTTHRMNLLSIAGTDWMVRVLTGEVVVSRRVATLVTRLFVHWLDSPKMRKKAQMNRVLEVRGHICAVSTYLSATRSRYRVTFRVADVVSRYFETQVCERGWFVLHIAFKNRYDWRTCGR